MKRRTVPLAVIFVIGLVLKSNYSCSGPENIANDAVVSASTFIKGYPIQNATDGIIGIHGKGEWACEGSSTFWGYIRYPWLQLDWSESKVINRIVIFDRPGLEEHTAGGTLVFSDGSEIPVTAIPNDGSPKTVKFPPKKVNWIRFKAMDGVGYNLGLSEIEVYPSYESYPDLVSWVDPFIETTRGRYFYFTPGATPFGMVAAAPITRNKNQYGGGYNYNSTEILGFGQIHSWMLSGIQIMPTTGQVNPLLGEQGWKSGFSHKDEIAQPGYQRVFLKKYKTWVELTSTRRTTIYRFTYTLDNEADILANLGGYLGNSTMTEADVRKVGKSKLEGSFVSTGRLWGGPKKVNIFFAIEFDKPFLSLNGWNGDQKLTDISVVKGDSKMTRRDSMDYGVVVQSYWDAPGTGIAAKYKVSAGDQIQMKISISYTSTKNAWENMNTEATHWDFNRYKIDSQLDWENILGRIEVHGGTYEQKVKFYTDLWHVLLGRHILNDVTGDYPDYTQGVRDWKFTDAEFKVKKLPANKAGKVRFNMYNSDALWLTQWNVNILWGLAWPEILDDFSASMVQYADNGGLLPRGPNAGGYSYIMTGNPATNMLVSNYMKGFMKKTDPLHAFQVMKRNHMPGGMMGDNPEEVEFYIENGYAPGNAGTTIEWAFQDWSLAQMAKKMGRNKDYRYFIDRSKGWVKNYNPKHKLLFPKKSDGSWLHDDPLSMSGWVEANAWQGTWSLSHDIPGLAKLMGGNDVLTEMLNHAFKMAEPDDFVFGYGNGYVSYANQPGCSNAHVFNYAGKPWLSQYWVRKVNKQAYGGISPDKGYGGHDEDQGQMGGVSALMSMGLFSLRGNNSIDPIYEITSPVFDEITIHLSAEYHGGKEFKILVRNNSEENMYIQSAKLNGKVLDKAWFYHTDFVKGGILELELGPEPNINWGSRPEDAPYTSSNE
ncbi:GH92 family glycosyl hydrolase [Bacteroidota bacterium]